MMVNGSGIFWDLIGRIPLVVLGGRISMLHGDRFWGFRTLEIGVLEVEKFTAPGDKEKRNTDGMTPAEVFSDTHQDLVKAGEQWMKDTAISCTTVATLIATMVFAAAITVPGGNNSNNGQPLLSKRKAFAIFGISDALALFSCII